MVGKDIFYYGVYLSGTVLPYGANEGMNLLNKIVQPVHLVLPVLQKLQETAGTFAIVIAVTMKVHILFVFKF